MLARSARRRGRQVVRDCTGLRTCFAITVRYCGGGKLPPWVSNLKFEGKLTGGLNATPTLDVDLDKALADLRAKAAANIEAEITRQVTKAAKDAIGIDAGDILKKPDVKDLLKGVLGG